MNYHLAAGLLLSALIGFVLGLIGGGGSIVTVPVLVYILGVEAHSAIGMSLAVVGVTSLVGVVVHAQRGNVDYRTGSFFGGAGIAGALAGSRLTHLLSPQALMIAFAVLMLAVALGMLLRRRHERKEGVSLWKAGLAGLAVGILTGFLGVGGGFLIVPALVFFGGLDMKQAVGTSLMVIAINCAAGFLGHMGQGRLPVGLTLAVTAIAATGTVGGTFCSQRVSAETLSRGFAVFVIVVAIFLIIKNV